MAKGKILTRPTSMLRKQMGQMAKLLGAWSKKPIKDPSQRQLDPPTNISRTGVPQFLSQTRHVRISHVTRRQFVLNRHFTEIISDVLALNFTKQIGDLGIKITSIETKAWNKGVSIFYSSTGPFDEKIRLKLQELVRELRSTIAERHLIGRTPHINFVFDESVLLDLALDKAMSEVKLDERKESELTTTSSQNQLYVAKDLGSQQPKLVSKLFVAPPDMVNTMCGLNYPELYDEVASKLTRGRGESSRMVPNTHALASVKPLFHAPMESPEGLDPATRVLKMQKFIVSQKQKSMNMARLKRKQEILLNEAHKWDVQEARDEPEIPDYGCSLEESNLEHGNDYEMKSTSENKQ